MSFLSSPLLYCGRQHGLLGELGRDRKLWRRNETLCIDVTEYYELKSALGFENHAPLSSYRLSNT
jgi:hypothetical protein